MEIPMEILPIDFLTTNQSSFCSLESNPWKMAPRSWTYGPKTPSFHHSSGGYIPKMEVQSPYIMVYHGYIMVIYGYIMVISWLYHGYIHKSRSNLPQLHHQVLTQTTRPFPWVRLAEKTEASQYDSERNWALPKDGSEGRNWSHQSG